MPAPSAQLQCPLPELGLDNVLDFLRREVRPESSPREMRQVPVLRLAKLFIGVRIRRVHGFFDCLDDLIERDIRLRGEYQLTDALQLMVERGAHLGTFPIADWFDCGTQEAMLDTNRHLLQDAPVPTHCTETVIVPPVHIDPTAEVRDSVIGPHVSIGAGARVQYPIVRNAIIGEQAEVEAALIENSLVGFQAVLKGRWSHLNIGDMSEITT